MSGLTLQSDYIPLDLHCIEMDSGVESPDEWRDYAVSAFDESNRILEESGSLHPVFHFFVPNAASVGGMSGRPCMALIEFPSGIEDDCWKAVKIAAHRIGASGCLMLGEADVDGGCVVLGRVETPYFRLWFEADVSESDGGVRFIEEDVHEVSDAQVSAFLDTEDIPLQSIWNIASA